MTLRDKANYADLSGLARIRWNTKMSGYHQIRPMVKLADGNVYVGDRADGSTRDWIVSEISFADLKWLKVDPARAVTTGNIVDKIDLSKVDEVGFIDLMTNCWIRKACTTRCGASRLANVVRSKPPPRRQRSLRRAASILCPYRNVLIPLHDSASPYPGFPPGIRTRTVGWHGGTARQVSGHSTGGSPR